MSEKSPYFAMDTNFYKDLFLNFIFFLVGYITVALSLSPWLPNLTEKKEEERKRMSLLTKMISFIIFLPNTFTIMAASFSKNIYDIHFPTFSY